MSLVITYCCIGFAFFLMGCRPGSYLHKIRDESEKLQGKNAPFNNICNHILEDWPFENVGFTDRKKDILLISFIMGIMWPFRVLYCLLYYVLYLRVWPIISWFFNGLAKFFVGDQNE